MRGSRGTYSPKGGICITYELEQYVLHLTLLIDIDLPAVQEQLEPCPESQGIPADGLTKDRKNFH